jgi:SWI/SNF-related matrix-associated actin-dependent regulator 1 of chromatin subfamily A
LKPLREHQIAGADWLLKNPHGYLADAPRVGKTRTLLSAFQRSGGKDGLIVVPAMVRSHWQHEAALMGIQDTVDIVSYDAVVRGFQPTYFPDALILDEAHFLKNPSSKRTKMIFGKKGFHKMTLTVWPASGTPIPKNPAEIYPLLAALHPEILRSGGWTTLEKFTEFFCTGYYMMIRNRRVYKITGGKNLDILRGILAPIMLRRTLEDLGGDVPTLDFQQLELNNEAVDGKLVAALAQGSDANAATARRLLGEFKAPMVADMIINQFETSNEKIAVFAYHRSVLDILRNRLREKAIAYSYIDGDTNMRLRDIETESFQSGHTRIFIGQSKACEVGIRLDAANTACIVEPSWTATDNVQLANRIVDAHRPGRHCVVQMVSLGGTVDDAIVAQNIRETAMAAELFGL